MPLLRAQPAAPLVPRTCFSIQARRLLRQLCSDRTMRGHGLHSAMSSAATARALPTCRGERQPVKSSQRTQPPAPTVPELVSDPSGLPTRTSAPTGPRCVRGARRVPTATGTCCPPLPLLAVWGALVLTARAGGWCGVCTFLTEAGKHRGGDGGLVVQVGRTTPRGARRYLLEELHSVLGGEGGGRRGAGAPVVMAGHRDAVHRAPRVVVALQRVAVEQRGARLSPCLPEGSRTAGASQQWVRAQHTLHTRAPRPCPAPWHQGC